MRKLALLAAAMATLSAVALTPTTADAGCYRLGMTGYHWYHFCAGPPVPLPTPARLPEWPLLVPLERIKLVSFPIGRDKLARCGGKLRSEILTSALRRLR